MKYGLVGEKLSHSYSKIIHEKLADYTYDLIPLTKEELNRFMLEKNFNGINVTIPYKQTVISYLDKIDSKAQKIGAVNTIVNRNGILTGYNTDYYGFLYMIKHNNISIKGKKVIILGSGGASKAVKAVINDLDSKELLIVNIHSGNDLITYEECYKNHNDAQIIINTSPVGMYPNSNDCPIDLTPFTKCEAVLDIIYNPIETMLSKQAKNLNIKSVTGLEMLIVQAKYACELFLDKPINDSLIDEIYNMLKKII